MRKSRSGHDVRELTGEPRVGGRLRILIDLWLLCGLAAEERRMIGVLAVDQRDEAQIVQFLFATIRDCDLSRALQNDVTFIGSEVDRRQSLDESATFNSANRRGPLVQRKRVGDAFGQSVSGIAP